MTTREELNASFDRLSEKVLRIKAERDLLVKALEQLLEASPTSSEDRRLIDAQHEAESLLKRIQDA